MEEEEEYAWRKMRKSHGGRGSFACCLDAEDQREVLLFSLDQI
jgi:hypothetical protein